jgi:hypothetical protein
LIGAELAVLHSFTDSMHAGIAKITVSVYGACANVRACSIGFQIVLTITGFGVAEVHRTGIVVVAIVGFEEAGFCDLVARFDCA